MTSLNSAQIRERIAFGYDPSREDADAWDVALDEINETHGENPMIALTYAQEQHEKDETFDPEEFSDLLQRTYRQCWETAAKFAEHVAEDEAEMGDPEEAKGRVWFLEKYGRFIDWQEFADSPEIVNTYSLVSLDPENSREVYAFAMEA